MNNERPLQAIHTKIWLYLILGLAIILRLPNLNESIWFDEWGYATHNFLRDLNTLFRIIVIDKSAPFYRVFMFFWTLAFGESEISIRLPSLICGILSIFLSYRIALKLTNIKVAVLTAILLCVSPVHIWYSQEAAPYSLTLFLLLSSVLLFYKMQEAGSASPPGRGSYILGYYLSTLLAVFTNYGALVFLMIISVLCLIKMDAVKRRIFFLNLSIFFLFIVFILLKKELGGRIADMDYLRPFTPFELWMLLFNWFSFGNSIWSIYPYGANPAALLKYPALLASQVFFLIVLVLGMVRISRNTEKTNGRDIILYLFALPLTMMCLSFAGLKQIYVERFAFFSIPFFFMILASGIFIFRSAVIRKACAAVLVLFMMTALTAYYAKNDTWTVYKHNPDWRSAAKYFAEESKSGSGSIYLLAPLPAGELRYYDNRFEEHRRLTPASSAFCIYYYYKDTIPMDQIYGLLTAAKVERIYLVKNKYWVRNFSELADRLGKDPRFQFEDKKYFKGLEIYKIKVRALRGWF